MVPAVSHQVRGGVELAIAVGRDLRRANTDEAAEAIAGHSVANGTSMRD